MREEEGAVGVDAAALAGGGAAAIEAPVPGGEDKDVGDPECACGLEEGDGGLAMRGERGDEKAERPDHVEGDDGGGDDADEAVEGVEAAPVGDDGGNGEDAEDEEEEPVGSPGEGFREGKAEASDGEEREHGGPAGFGFDVGLRRGGGHGSEIAQIVHDLGGGPVLGADEFAADDAVGINNVGLGRPGGVEGVVGALGEVEDGGDAGDVVIADVLLVSAGVGVEGDGDDGDVGHAALQVDEGGKLFEAGRAPAGPEIEDDDFALVLIGAEADGLRSVLDDDSGGVLADLSGVAGAIAA